MNTTPEFFETGEHELAKHFLENGFVIQAVEDRESLEQIRQLATTAASEYLGVESDRPVEFLNNIHREIATQDLNDLRLNVIGKLNADPASRRRYYSLARKLLAALVGNELAMQLRLNLSIQLPGDDSSLLPVHADVWSGDSPFEVVVWLPLTDCFNTKSMFLLPPVPTRELHKRFGTYQEKSSEDLYQDIKKDVSWINIEYGQVMIFNQNLPHGNRINLESETRWSINCRFKSVFSPYGDKKLGEFFEPVTLRPTTQIGLDYRFPLFEKPKKS